MNQYVLVLSVSGRGTHHIWLVGPLQATLMYSESGRIESVLLKLDFQ